MDKKLLDALNNLAVALEEISEAMKKSKSDKGKSATNTALSSGKIDKKLDAITKGIDQVKSDNKKILKNQEQLLKIAKEQKATGAIGDSTDPKKRNKIKDGLGTIMLIAVGVLAIGLAFRLIGKVDFFSVIALSIALPLLAFAFEKIAKIEGLTPKRMILITLSLIAMSWAIAKSSEILNMVQPVGFFKLLTAILIGAAFVGIAYSMRGIIEGVANVSILGVAKMVLFGPLLLYTMSYAIMLSSKILGQVKPVGIFKLITAIGIAGAMVVLSYGLKGIVGAFAKTSLLGMFNFLLRGPAVMVALAKTIAMASVELGKVKPVGFFKLFTAILISAAFAALGVGLGRILDAFSKIKISVSKALFIAVLMPIMLVALAYAVAGASLAFQKIKPVGLFKIITAILIGIAFIPLSFALALILWGLSKVNVKQALMLPIVMVVLATAIYLSSKLFAKTESIPWIKMLNIIVQAITLAIVSVVLSVAIWVIKKLKVNVDDAIEGGIILIILAAVIMTSSLILAVGDYTNYPSLKWLLGVGVSLMAFALISTALGGIAMSGVGAAAFFLGIPLILSMAGTIVAVSHILAEGTYDLPGIGNWALSVVLLYSVFTPILLILGAVAMANAVASVFGANPWESAREMILQIADTIVEVGYVLQKGTFTGGPTFEWASGVAIALGAFSPIYGMLVANKIFEWLGGGGIGPEEFNEAIRTVVSGIIFAAEEFNKTTAAFQGGPKKEWAEGVGLAIGAFSPVYAMLVKNEILKAIGGKGGIGPEEFATAIMVVCRGIVDAAKFFGSPENTGVFDLSKVPQKEWGENVGKAIQAFIPALEYIHKSRGWFKKADPNVIRKGIMVTSESIRDASFALSGGKYDKTVTKDWVQNTAGGVKEFMSLAKWLKENSDEKAAKKLNELINSISYAAKNLSKVNWNKTIKAKWVEDTRRGLIKFIDLATYVGGLEGLFDESSIASGLTGGGFSKKGSLGILMGIIRTVVDTSTMLSEGKWNKTITSKWSSDTEVGIHRYLLLARAIAANKDLDSALNTLGRVRDNILYTADLFSRGSWTKTVSKKWMNTVDYVVRMYVDLASYYIYPKRKWLGDALWKLGNTISHMVRQSFKFRTIKRNLRGIDEDLLENLGSNVKYYVRLALWLAKSKYRGSMVMTAVDGIWNLSRSYSKLAESISKLNAELQKLDVEKLNAIKSLNTSVILMSLMDPEQFREMMEELDKKGMVLFEEVNEMKNDEKAPKNNATQQVKTGGGGGESAGKSMTDLYSIMEQVNATLGEIVKSSNVVSNYINTLQTQNKTKPNTNTSPFG